MKLHKWLGLSSTCIFLPSYVVPPYTISVVYIVSKWTKMKWNKMKWRQTWGQFKAKKSTLKWLPMRQSRAGSKTLIKERTILSRTSVIPEFCEAFSSGINNLVKCPYSSDCPMASADVKWSFSLYESIFTDSRTGFTDEKLKKVIICHCFYNKNWGWKTNYFQLFWIFFQLFGYFSSTKIQLFCCKISTINPSPSHKAFFATW